MWECIDITSSCEYPMGNVADGNRLQYCPAYNGESISTVIYTKNTTVDNLNMYVYLHNNEHNEEKRVQPIDICRRYLCGDFFLFLSHIIRIGIILLFLLIITHIGCNIPFVCPFGSNTRVISFTINNVLVTSVVSYHH